MYYIYGFKKLYAKGSDILKVQKRYPITKLNNHDKKVINKYTKFYTNMIESNTAAVDNLIYENFNRKQP